MKYELYEMMLDVENDVYKCDMYEIYVEISCNILVEEIVLDGIDCLDILMVSKAIDCCIVRLVAYPLV